MTVAGKKSVYWIVYVPSILIIIGVLSLFIVVVQPFQLVGMWLFASEKTILKTIAGIFLLSGFFLWTPLGTQLISIIIPGLTDSEIRQIRVRRSYRILNCLILFMGFLFSFCFFLIQKNIVFHLNNSRIYNDTYGYVLTGSYPFSNINFWAGVRSFTNPIFYKLIGYTPLNYRVLDEVRNVARIQMIFSAFSWTIFALSISLVLKDKLAKVIGFTVILMLGASIYITAWDNSILSESLSISLLLLFLATIIVGGMAWDKKHPIPVWKQFILVGAILIIGILYSFTRDPNEYFILFIAGLMIFGIFFTPIRKNPLFYSYLAVIVGFLAIFVGQTISFNIGKRFRYSIISEIIIRIIPSQENLNYYLKHGMPFDAKVAALKIGDFHMVGYHQNTDVPTIDPPVQPFVDWVDNNGERVTMQFLLSRPVFFFTAPWQDFWQITNGDYTVYRTVISSPNSLTVFLTALFYPRTTWWPYLTAILILITIIAVWKSKDRKAIWSVTLVLFLLAYPLAILVWQSDPTDIERHALQIALQLRLASWIAIALILEQCIGFLKKRRII